jgi:putative ABC transport system permease protein
MKLGTIALRNISRNRKRSFLSMTAIAVAAMTITMMFSLIAGMKNDMKENTQSYTTGQVRIRNREYNRFEQLNPMHLGVEKSDDLVRRLIETEGVAEVSPRITFPGSIFLGEQRHSVYGMGVDFSHERSFMNLDLVLGRGRLPEAGKNETVIGYRLAEQLGLEIGDRMTILTTTRTRGTNAFTVEITGLLLFPVDVMNNNTLLIPLDRARNFLWMGDTVTEVLVKFEKGISDERGEAIAASVLADMGIADAQAQEWLSVSTFASMFDYVETVYLFVALFFFILGSTVIINTTMMTVFERIREIGTLGAMGMEGKSLVKLFFLEAFFLGTGGSLLGVLLGIAIVLPLSHFGIDYGEAMEGMDMGISSIIYPILNLRSTVFVFFYSLAAASLTSLIPSSKAAKIEPVEALRSV